MVPETGLEPALVSQPDPKSGASTNSATQALRAACPTLPEDRLAVNSFPFIHALLGRCLATQAFFGSETKPASP